MTKMGSKIGSKWYKNCKNDQNGQKWLKCTKMVKNSKNDQNGQKWQK